MLYVKATIMLIGLAVTLLRVMASAAQDQPRHEPFIDFAWQGGRSPYRSVQVTVTAAGTVNVLAAKQVGPAVNYATTLTRDELGALREAVAVVCASEEESARRVVPFEHRRPVWRPLEQRRHVRVLAGGRAGHGEPAGVRS